MEERISPPQSKEDFWRSHIAGWRESGLNQRAYCEQHGLSKSALGWWRSKLARQAAGNFTLVPLPFLKGTVVRNRIATGLTLVVGNHYRIEVGDDFHATTLARLLKTLG
jgi:transposase